MTYYVIHGNQRMEVPVEIGNDDSALRKVLSTVLPDLVNSKLERKVNEANGDVEITVVAIPGKKG